jgi:hypothetical protein
MGDVTLGLRLFKKMQHWNILADKYSIEYVVCLLCQNFMVERAESIAAASKMGNSTTIPGHPENIPVYICLARASAIMLNTEVAKKYIYCVDEEIKRAGLSSSRVAIQLQQTSFSVRVLAL